MHLQPRGRVFAWEREPRRVVHPLIHRCHDYEVTFSPKCFCGPQPALIWSAWSAVDVRRTAKRSSAPTPVPGQPGPGGLHSASLSRQGSHCKQVSSPGSTYCRVFYTSLCFWLVTMLRMSPGLEPASRWGGAWFPPWDSAHFRPSPPFAHSDGDNEFDQGIFEHLI